MSRRFIYCFLSIVSKVLRIESFTEYILIAQDRPHIKKLLRQEAGAWLETEVNSLDGEIYLSSLDCSLSLRDLYEGVAFPENRIPFNVR